MRALVELTALAEQLGHRIRITHKWLGDLAPGQEHAKGFYWSEVDGSGNFLVPRHDYFLGHSPMEAADALHNLNRNNPGPELPEPPKPAQRKSREGIKNVLASAADHRAYVKRLRVEADAGNPLAITGYLYLKHIGALVDKPTLVSEKPRESNGASVTALGISAHASEQSSL